MPAFYCTPRRLVLLICLGLITTSVTYISNAHYAYYQLRGSGSAVSQNNVAGVDLSYLATAFDLSEPDLHRLVEAPTKDLVEDLLHVLNAKGHDFDALKAEKLRSDLGQQQESTSQSANPPSQPETKPAPAPQPATYQGLDPHLIDKLKLNSDFYIQNGVRTLQSETNVQPQIYKPYPDYNSPGWRATWRGNYASCRGARNQLLGESDQDMVRAYPALPSGFPNVSLGDAGISRLNLHYCFDRFNRYGPYGFRHVKSEIVEGWQRPQTMPDWTSVIWYQLQDECIAANQNRYEPSTRHPIDLRIGKAMPPQLPALSDAPQSPDPKYHHRTAVLLRSSHEHQYTENELQSIRAMITELSLLSGGEYQVFNLVHVSDETVNLFESTHDHTEILRTIPREMRSISILWNNKLLKEWYPEVGNWDGSYHSLMPLQWFILNRPEFDYVWNWGLDSRFTGNYYEFLDGLAAYAKVIPRKHLWERNARYFVPSLHSDYTYDWFLAETDDIVQKAENERGHQSIWGPHPHDATVQQPIGPSPPRSYSEDGFQWGSGEEADLITLQPMFDPANTTWEHRHDIWNFIPAVRPYMEEGDLHIADAFHAQYAELPRRASLGQTMRLSKRQLLAMHHENRAGRTMHAEMWAPTVALHHGLKAIYAPHPIWTNRVWAPATLDGIFNADQGEPPRWSATPGSAYDADRNQVWDGLSWSPSGGFAKALYRRWMGWTSVEPDAVAGIGGEAWERTGSRRKVKDYDGPVDEKGYVLVGGRGRMCLPPMFLHPVGDVYEAAEETPARGKAYG